MYCRYFLVYKNLHSFRTAGRQRMLIHQLTKSWLLQEILHHFPNCTPRPISPTRYSAKKTREINSFWGNAIISLPIQRLTMNTSIFLKDQNFTVKNPKFLFSLTHYHFPNFSITKQFFLVILSNIQFTFLKKHFEKGKS